MEILNVLKQIINNFEEVQTLYDDEHGSYLATGYWLSEDDYFKLIQAIEDIGGLDWKCLKNLIQT